MPNLSLDSVVIPCHQYFTHVCIDKIPEQASDYADDDLEEILGTIAYEVREVSEGNFENRFDLDAHRMAISGTAFEHLNYMDVSTGSIICTLRKGTLRFRFHPNKADRLLRIKPRLHREVLEAFARCLDEEFSY